MNASVARWHDLEMNGYSSDLAVWNSLIERYQPLGLPVADLGAGTGRVSRELAMRGWPTIAVESDAALLAALKARIAPGMPLSGIRADLRDLDRVPQLGGAIAAMLVVHLLGGVQGRRAMFTALASKIVSGGWFGISLSPSLPSSIPESAAIESRRSLSLDGWASTTCLLATGKQEQGLDLVNARSVSFGQTSFTQISRQQLDDIDPDQLIDEAAKCGFGLVERLSLPPTNDSAETEVLVLRVS